MKTILLYLSLLSLVWVSCAKNINYDEQLLSVPDQQMGLNVQAITNDPFAEYFNSIPAVVQIISTTNSISGGTAITTKRFTFSSKNGANTIFAIMAYPQAAGTYPAIMFNHGGGGNAEAQITNVTDYAGKGYVTIAIDIPSIAEKTKTPNSTGAWKTAANGEEPRLNVTGGVKNSTLFDAGVGALQAFNYLSAQPNVNKDKIGISGTSWGGYMTTMLSGMLGNRVKAAYAIYGCGFYDRGSFWSTLISQKSAADRNTWLTYLDAGRRCPFITAPYFIEQASNDTYFWPEAVSATLNAIPGTKNHVVMSNLNHKEIPAAGLMKSTYMNYYLKGIGSPFGSIEVANTVTQADGSLQVNMKVNIPAGISVGNVQLYYAVPAANWQSYTWIPIAATQSGSTSTYSAIIPASLVNQNVSFYGEFEDSRTVMTSTNIYQTGFMNNCDVLSGWGSGNTLSLDIGDKKEGKGSLKSVGSATDEFKIHLATPYNPGVSAITGSIIFWYYVSDVTKFSAGDQIELGSGGAPDVNEFSWGIGPVVNGWNLISKPFSGASITGGVPDVNALNWFRIYHVKTGTVTTKVDGIQIMR